MTTTDPEVTLSITDGVATITIDRPAVMNAISGRVGGTRDQLIDALTTAENDPTVGCAILTGAGAHFSGGGDLTGNAHRTTAAEHRAFLEAADRFHDRFRNARIPVVAAVSGYCLGAGVLLASSCDLVIAADDAKFGFPEGRLGLVGATGVVTRVGAQWATFLMLTGEAIDAETARSLGLVLTVEAASELDGRVRDLAGRISRMPREAVLLNRRAIRAAAEAAGDVAARAAAIEADTETLGKADQATAPDGRTFRSIIDAEGMSGVKAARAAQYTDSWLR